MANFAELDENNIVIRVIVVGNDSINNLPFPASNSVGQKFCQSIFGKDTRWEQTSYNGSFRNCYAGIGYIFDEKLNVFIPPKPFKSWTFDEINCNWIPPIRRPNDDKVYFWNEDKMTWDEENLHLENPTGGL